MKELKVEVMVVDPPCKRCQATLKNVEEATSALRADGIAVHVSRLNVASKDVIAKYGAVVAPSLAVNDVAKIIGRVPDKKEVERILRAIVK